MSRTKHKSYWIKRVWAVLAIIFTALLVFLAVRPLPQPSLENSEIVIGVLEVVVEDGGPWDLVFRLRDDGNAYYINRGVQLGLDAKQLMEYFEGQELTIFYAKHWTLLDLDGSSRHITKIMSKDSIIYKEF